MKTENRNAEWVLSSDALKLLVILDAFIWFVAALHWGSALGDFSVLYTAGGVILEGHRTQLFDVPTQIEFQQRILGMHKFLPFNHLAYESLFFIPLALLPFRWGLWIWRALSLGMLLLSTRLLADSFHVVRAHLLALSLASFPIIVAVLQGQDSILLLLLLTASLATLNKGQDRLAGILLAFALFKPHLILPIAAVLVWRRGYRFSQGFLGGSAVVFLLSTGITGLKGWKQLAGLMRYAASGTGDQIGGVAKLRPNLRGIMDLSGVSVHTALILTVVISAVLFLLVAWHLRNQRSPEVLFPPLAALALVTSIHVNTHDLSLLLIPIVAMLVQKRKAAALVAGACFCMPLFSIAGYPALFFFVICAALFLTTFAGTSGHDQWSSTAEADEHLNTCASNRA